MDEHHRIDNVAGPLIRPKSGGTALWPRPVLADEVSRVLAVCEPGSLEDRLRTATRMLGQDVRFLRTFPDALETLREQFYEIVVVAKTNNGMLARDFVRETRKISDDSVVVVAAPDSRITRKPLSKLDPSFYGKIIIGGIFRDGEWQIAVGDTHILATERAIVVCTSLHLKDVQRLFLA